MMRQCVTDLKVDAILEKNAPDKRIPAKRVRKLVREGAERRPQAECGAVKSIVDRGRIAARIEQQETEQEMRAALRGRSASEFLGDDDAE